MVKHGGHEEVPGRVIGCYEIALPRRLIASQPQAAASSATITAAAISN
jgi:hypothetical protein